MGFWQRPLKPDSSGRKSMEARWKPNLRGQRASPSSPISSGQLSGEYFGTRLRGAPSAFVVAIVRAKQYPNAEALILTALPGVLVVALGRCSMGKTWAARTLALLAVRDGVARLTQHAGGASMPLILLLLSVHAAIVMRRYSARQRSLSRRDGESHAPGQKPPSERRFASDAG